MMKFKNLLTRENILYFCLLGAVAFLMLYSLPTAKTAIQDPTSAVLEDFKRTEELWQKKMQNPKRVEEYLDERPLLAVFFNFLSFILIGAFSAGLILDFLFFFRPGWRRQIMRRGPPDPDWPLKLFFQTLILWLAINLCLSYVSGWLVKFQILRVDFNAYALFHTTAMDLVCVGLVILMVRRAGGHWKDLGLHLRVKEIWQEIKIGLAGYVAVLPIFFIVLLFLVFITKFLAYEPPPHPLVGIFLEEEKKSPFLIAYSIFLACVLGPLLEEIFFRGFCYPIFKRRWGNLWGMVASSALFALIHQNQFAFWPIFVLGMGLAFLYEKRRNLVAPVTLHIVHNSVFIAYFFLAKSVITDVNF